MASDEVIRDLIKRVDELERGMRVLRGQQIFIPASPTSNMYSIALTTDYGGNNTDTTVLRFFIAGLTMPPGAISKMRFTFQAGNAEGCIITNAYVGHGSTVGNAWNFATTPVQLTWSGSASVTIPALSTATTDWASFAYNKALDLMVAFYTNGGIAADTLRLVNPALYVNNYFKAATNEAAAVAKSAGYTTNVSIMLGVNRVESDGF